MVMDYGKAIVKRFPKGYIVHSYAMQQVVLPCECWMIVEHHGTNADGLEVFLALTGRKNTSMAAGIAELKAARG